VGARLVFVSQRSNSKKSDGTIPFHHTWPCEFPFHLDKKPVIRNRPVTLNFRWTAESFPPRYIPSPPTIVKVMRSGSESERKRLVTRIEKRQKSKTEGQDFPSFAAPLRLVICNNTTRPSETGVAIQNHGLMKDT